ncbi:hypothetical protein GPECTOR_6g579 [Gonium pectorale]|uniref:Uncharacterized protein n=1 Tax=Gonium pectorale TaxID=33097 RepID=A0A150GVD4_GONPE|nr:hypothetical protein GPECTOR_6g579 [Gonium pectorale]|eukprot:KXZ53662.1 hypothetical protein GPECTOR_6g579 [Gonium pectorale]
MGGEGGYAYFAYENTEPTELAVSAGHALFNPQGQWHKVWNNGSEPLVLMAISKALAPYEVLSDWPENPDDGGGFIPDVLPWETSCPPGHEPDPDQQEGGELGYEEGEAGDAEADGGFTFDEPQEEGDLVAEWSVGEACAEAEAGPEMDPDQVEEL